MSDDLLLHLSLIQGVGHGTITLLMNYSDELICDANDIQLMRWGMTQHHAALVRTGLRDRDMLAREQAAIGRHQIQLLTIQHPEFPSYLRAIHQPPVVLYARGDTSKLQNSALAMVGSRTARGYGREVIEHLVAPVVRAGWTVVSGGARGIDAYAHKETLKARGCTVAVLGSGLLRPYPAEHRNLFEKIAKEGGAVISPFPLHMDPKPGNFPARNRIIAGLSRACIVVQAAVKSGALITAAQALAEGRDVGVVPGSIFDPLSVGCHRLLREGATPITSQADVEELMGLSPHRASLPEATHSRTTAATYQELDVIESACREPKSFDELLAVAACEAHILHQKLWDLQIKGTIEQTGAGLWRLLR